MLGLGLSLTAIPVRGKVSAPPAPVPVNTIAPAITGSASQGSTLTVSNGTWTNSPTGYAYQWLQDGVTIVGATAATYALVSGDVGHMISCRVTATNANGSGQATAAAVGPITAVTGDPYFANVTSLLHMDGANADTSFTDQKGIVYTPLNGAKLSAANAKFGTAAADLSTSSARLSAPSNAGFGVGTGDFTIEAFVCVPVLSGFHFLFDTTSRSSAAGFSIYLASDGSVGVGGGAGVASSPGAYSAGSYPHLAVARQSGVMRIFLGGAQVASGSAATDYPTTGITLGSIYDGSGNYLRGYIDEFRFTKGVARYTAAFTPPTAAFPDS
jgi:hypothetical protein